MAFEDITTPMKERNKVNANPSSQIIPRPGSVDSNALIHHDGFYILRGVDSDFWMHGSGVELVNSDHKGDKVPVTVNNPLVIQNNYHRSLVNSLRTTFDNVSDVQSENQLYDDVNTCLRMSGYPPIQKFTIRRALSAAHSTDLHPITVLWSLIGIDGIYDPSAISTLFLSSPYSISRPL